MLFLCLSRCSDLPLFPFARDFTASRSGEIQRCFTTPRRGRVQARLSGLFVGFLKSSKRLCLNSCPHYMNPLFTSKSWWSLHSYFWHGGHLRYLNTMSISLCLVLSSPLPSSFRLVFTCSNLICDLTPCFSSSLKHYSCG